MIEYQVSIYPYAGQTDLQALKQGTPFFFKTIVGQSYDTDAIIADMNREKGTSYVAATHIMGGNDYFLVLCVSGELDNDGDEYIIFVEDVNESVQKLPISE